MLERKGIEINTRSGNGYLPIHYACCLGSIEVTTYILTKIETLSKTEIFSFYLFLYKYTNLFFYLNYSPLYLAAEYGSTQIIKLLLKHGAKIDPRNEYDPMSSVIKSKNIECLKELLKGGYMNNGRETQTPIMLAIQNNRPKAVPLLIEAGDNPNQFDNNFINFIIC